MTVTSMIQSPPELSQTSSHQFTAATPPDSNDSHVRMCHLYGFFQTLGKCKPSGHNDEAVRTDAQYSNVSSVSCKKKKQRKKQHR